MQRGSLSAGVVGLRVVGGLAGILHVTSKSFFLRCDLLVQGSGVRVVSENTKNKECCDSFVNQNVRTITVDCFGKITKLPTFIEEQMVGTVLEGHVSPNTLPVLPAITLVWFQHGLAGTYPPANWMGSRPWWCSESH
jgi:hypothetical protein